jgi:hypothetical protein
LTTIGLRDCCHFRIIWRRRDRGDMRNVPGRRTRSYREFHRTCAVERGRALDASRTQVPVTCSVRSSVSRLSKPPRLSNEARRDAVSRRREQATMRKPPGIGSRNARSRRRIETGKLPRTTRATCLRRLCNRRRAAGPALPADLSPLAQCIAIPSRSSRQKMIHRACFARFDHFPGDHRLERCEGRLLARRHPARGYGVN